VLIDTDGASAGHPTDPTDEFILDASGVTKTYRTDIEEVVALRDVDLRVRAGEFLAVMGPSGSGKTTLLNCLSGLDDIDRGTILVGGRDIAAMSDADRTRHRASSMGFIFQAFNLIPTLTAQENVETALVPWHVGGDERRRRAREALDGVGLGERARHIPSEMSGGEQQRVAIARALVREPRVILADEPTGNLDERTRDDIIGLLEELWRERGQTLIVVTHDTWVASRASRRIWLDAGKLAPERRAGSSAEPQQGEGPAEADEAAGRLLPEEPALV